MHGYLNRFCVPFNSCTRKSIHDSWYTWLGAVAVTSASIGGAWDVSWHRSIGRDTFWTPAHMAIYACGVLAAIICGYLILVTSFGSSQKAQSLFG